MDAHVAEINRVCAAHGRITRHHRICRAHVAIDFELDEFPPSRPGQFLQILCRDDSNAGGSAAFLRRPFSIADHVIDANGRSRLTVISRNIGVGTNWLDHLSAGDTLNVTGPCGRGFALPDRDIPIVLAGGGVGIPPLLYLCRTLTEQKRRNVTVIFGALTHDLVPIEITQDPDRHGAPLSCARLPGDAAFPTAITTDDGSGGLRGCVTDALERWCDTTRPPPETLVCACGPEGMLHAVAATTRRRNLRCQLCIERHMGCGLGTCLSCIVRRRAADRPVGWRWALTCTDGPVFSRDDLPDYDDSACAAGGNSSDSP